MEPLSAGDTLTLRTTGMAHGGEAIARADDGRVIFVAGALPDETVIATVTKAKKRWARATLDTVIAASEHRVEPYCDAFRAGAGCCDLSYFWVPEAWMAKHQILQGQIEALAGRSGVMDEFEQEQTNTAVYPLDGDVDDERGQPEPWRTRVRFGVNAQGQAGVRKAKSNDIVTVRCAQVLPEIYGELRKHRFTPGAEVVAVRDGLGEVHVVETQRVPRGRRVETIEKVVAGTGTVTEIIGDYTFTFPATAFWQAHKDAPALYDMVIRQWAVGDYTRAVGWDLYGGVGAFVPSIAETLGHDATVYSVDYSPAANAASQDGLWNFEVKSVKGKVESVVDKLPDPGLVVLDPPRTGAGAHVVAAIAAKRPERVIHIGCDPATFARDLAAWGENRYRVKRYASADAFPGTHHFEALALLEPAHGT
ncbi:class I SAM-dependent RNA methyltransferase [Corynebacterium cystitidis]|uniref:tRNA/tmRNA/rRNA uracil-C5-methylase, TrmA/RlmC/RlmD family n=1 Tax=Corynebacterium cystitidis DSM 20524 TaxID=1121357 RepID=A0A1H9PC01_9CORY|nr:TRAM domain-containing protein [Corynebacterium cystitidis]WJY82567.1 putative RNA methyltransferase [Corynebacterium cystitidis DSM 20524]SER45103.1 tRNA/tmRNA/rRNA uracil-C5-methylase, TrmA/RlmC/RlmD family [Corynebacterium cystitidis DSM 20524]SNV73334.1 SAM-dependent methyltransferase [Corynebacterium cystitidis]